MDKESKAHVAALVGAALAMGGGSGVYNPPEPEGGIQDMKERMQRSRHMEKKPQKRCGNKERRKKRKRERDARKKGRK